LDDVAGPTLTISWDNGTEQVLTNSVLPPEASIELFMRSGAIRRVELVISPTQLFVE
jgi:hypothetical protein